MANHHPVDKGERKKEKQLKYKKLVAFGNFFEELKHRAIHNMKKLKPTSRQRKAALGEKEQNKNFEEMEETLL